MKYEGYLKREEAEREKFRAGEGMLIPSEFDYTRVEGLSLESKQRLSRVRPVSLGQASRIRGIRPSDPALIMVYLKKWGQTSNTE